MAMDGKKPSVPSDGRAKETSEVRNKRKSMTCPEEEAYVDRGWATAAHIPALHALSDDFELAGVANTSLASARAAAAAFGLPRAFESTAELVASPDVDVVVVTVKVPYHRELVSEALNAGKSVYCEWPLGNGLAEAVELARLANNRKLPGVVGTQAIASPEVEYVRKIVADGYVGELLSATYIGAGLTWGNDVPRGDVYAMASKNGDRPRAANVVEFKLKRVACAASTQSEAHTR
jgi:predicted dehydrogenase